MDDDKLAIEEARRAGQHGSVKAQVEGEVQAEIAEHAARPAQPDAAKVGQVAEEFRAKAVDEVVQTEREVGRARGVARISLLAANKANKNRSPSNAPISSTKMWTKCGDQ